MESNSIGPGAVPEEVRGDGVVAGGREEEDEVWLGFLAPEEDEEEPPEA